MRYHHSVLGIAFGHLDARYVTLGSDKEDNVIQVGYRSGSYHDIFLVALIISICQFDSTLAKVQKKSSIRSNNCQLRFFRISPIRHPF